MGRVGKALVHDINNMLTAIVCHAELGLVKNHDAAAAAEHFKEIKAIGTRAGAIHDRFISFSEQERKDLSTVELNAVIEETLSAMGPQIGDHITLETQVEAHLPPVKADADDLHRALNNLLLNAIEAMEGKEGTITLTVRAEPAAVVPSEAIGRQMDGRPAVLLEVADTGCGMSEDTAAQLFEPFFSTKGSSVASVC